MFAARAVQNFGRQTHHGPRAFGDAVEGAGVLAVRVRQPIVQLPAIGGVVVGCALFGTEIHSVWRTYLVKGMENDFILNVVLHVWVLFYFFCSALLCLCVCGREKKKYSNFK